jgi:hypothetical protein
VQTSADLDRVERVRDIDLIWCGSILTHLDASQWPRLLGLLRRVPRQERRSGDDDARAPTSSQAIRTTAWLPGLGLPSSRPTAREGSATTTTRDRKDMAFPSPPRPG